MGKEFGRYYKETNKTKYFKEGFWYKNVIYYPSDYPHPIYKYFKFKELKKDYNITGHAYEYFIYSVAIYDNGSLTYNHKIINKNIEHSCVEVEEKEVLEYLVKAKKPERIRILESFLE